MNNNVEREFNLIMEPLIQVRKGDEELRMSLPEVLEHLGRGTREIDFVHLRPFQHHAWYAFLVQLASMALISSGENDPCRDAAEWTELLLGLTAEDEDPWCVYVKDLSKPAFMQPPVPEGQIVDRWNEIYTPGMLDLLVTSKNHDVKIQLINSPAVDHWCYSLVSVQTMEGFLGRGNYGIVRMNGGFGSRPCVTFVRSTEWGARFVRDVPILLAEYDNLLNSSLPYSGRDGHKLLWTFPWDGEGSIDIAECDPYFIEVCRRIRLKRKEGSLTAFGISTSTSRVAGEELHGVTGDPWTPIDKIEGKALTISSAGFTYQKLHQLLIGGEYMNPSTWRQRGENGDMYLVASALTRGQGKTEGYHHRELPVPQPVLGMLETPEGRDRLAEMSESRLQICQQVRNNLLNRALCVITQGAPEGRLDFRDSKTRPWLSVLDREIDAIYFDRLFAQVERNKEEADLEWTRELLELAEEQLEDAIESIPQPSLRRYRIECAARRVFHGSARKAFPDLFKNGDDGTGMNGGETDD